MSRPTRLDPKVGPVEKVQIQRRVALARAQAKPVGWAVLAKQEDVPVRTLSGWHTDWLKVQEFYDDPLGLVSESLDVISELIHVASADIAKNDANPNAKIGFIRVLLDLMVKRVNLLVQVGRMPRDIGDFEGAGKVRQMIQQMAEVVERHDLGPEVIDDLLSIVEQSKSQHM